MFFKLIIVVLATVQFGSAQPIVVVSQDQLRQDIRKEVTAVVQQATANITDSIDHEIIAQVNAALEDTVTNVSTAIEILLKPLMDQLFQPAGKTSTNPATSCEAVKVHDPTAPSGYYWIQNSDIPLVQVYCKMDEVEQMIGKDPRHPASCKEVKELNPGTPSGYYWIKEANESSIHVYCDMTRTCGGITGGWMRVANIDMKNTSHTCPQGLRQIIKGSKRLCTITISTAGCSSATFDVHGTEYTHVCGKVIGYQDRGPNAFYPYYNNQSLTLEDGYVDGVVLTHGSNPRKHIWTFAASYGESGSFAGQCFCMNKLDTRSAVPPWVGNDYFCDSGTSIGYVGILYPDDPLWDGEGCGPTSTCCSFNTPPWFSKQLLLATTDSIELRICTDESYYEEDVPIEIIELYVQ